MITKKDIVAMVHHVLRRGAGYADRREIHPMREWVTGLAVVFVLFVLASGYAGYEFYVLRQGNMHLEFQEGSGVTYNQKGVQRILETYTKRQNTFESLRADRSNIFIAPPAADEKVEGITNVASTTKKVEVPLAE